MVELLHKAIEWQALMESGKVANQAKIARHVGIIRARVTPVMGMLRLAPEIQECILAMPEMGASPQPRSASYVLSHRSDTRETTGSFLGNDGPKGHGNTTSHARYSLITIRTTTSSPTKSSRVANRTAAQMLGIGRVVEALQLRELCP